MKNPGNLSFLRRHLNASRIAVLSFAALILLGALLLMLPVASAGPALGFVDALFTATSAVCVTGLTVVDTGTWFTPFGQAVVLSLIQVGGFGIMSLSTFILFMFGRRVSLHVSENVGGAFLVRRNFSLGQMVRGALLFTVGVETLFAAVLFFRFCFDFPPARALWLAVFHAVSAFCNAGFSLFPDSLMRYASDPVVNLAVMLPIILGGLGFFVVMDCQGLFFRRKIPFSRRLSFHTKIVLLMTGVLILGGAVFFFLVERGHSLQGAGLGTGAMQTLFQSVTARTAGFNTLDIQHLSNASLFMLVMLMFIGGAPGSMAGGVKVTTAGVIIIAVIARLRGRPTPHWAGRSISRGDLDRAISLVLLYAALAGSVTMALLVTELGGIPHIESRGLFLELVFETVSAFGTVGLTTGVTPGLTTPGRLLIVFAMFAGRLGPLTLVFALERKRPPLRLKYPGEKIMIG